MHRTETLPPSTSEVALPSQSPISEADLRASIPSFLLPEHEDLKTLSPWQIMDCVLAQIRSKEGFISSKAELHPTAIVDVEQGPVVIMHGARIFPYAVLKGPLYICPRVIIGDHSIVRGSFVGQASVLGERSIFVRSVALSRLETHISYIGDSLIGRDTHIAGGCKTANLNLNSREIRNADGRTRAGAVFGNNCEVGANVLTMPGTIIGKECIVYPGTTLYGTIPNGHICGSRPSFQMKPINSQQS